MSEVTAVPLRPITKGSLAKLWTGVAAVVVIAIAGAWFATEKQVAMAMPAATFLAQNAKRAGVQTTASGLQYEVIAPGHGAKATTSDVVVVDYDGKLANGETFDASSRHGGPATLPVSGLMKLARGAIFSLDQRVGDPVDVVVNGTVIARGEIVVVDDASQRFGVSLLEVAAGGNVKRPTKATQATSDA